MKREKIPGCGIRVADPGGSVCFVKDRWSGRGNVCPEVDIKSLVVSKVQALALHGPIRYLFMIVGNGYRVGMGVVST